MVKEHVLPYFDAKLLVGFGKLTVYFRCLDLLLADTLALCLGADAQPRGRRSVDPKSFDWKLRKIKELAAETSVDAEEYQVPSFLHRARLLEAERNDFLHGNIQIDRKSGSLQVVRSRTRHVTTTAIYSLCDKIDLLVEEYFFGLADWADKVKQSRLLGQKIREILEIPSE